MYRIYDNIKTRIEHTGYNLLENKTYYIELDLPHCPKAIKAMESENIKPHISWYRGNNIAELRVENYIGTLTIFGQRYDVRSQKFGDTLSGSEQLKLITSDLDKLSKKITFSIESSIGSNAISNWEISENDIRAKLNFLYYAFYDANRTETAILCFSLIKNNPAKKYSNIKKYISSRKIKKITPPVLNNLLKYSKIENGKIDIPEANVHSDFKELSTNTSENQFVKFFYEYCSEICLRVLNLKKTNELISEKAGRLLSDCRLILSNPFFKGIKSPSLLNLNSTVLRARAGYRNLITYYIKSLFSFQHLYLEKKDSFISGIQDIASLYELWCFYKVSHAVLGDNISIKDRGTYIEDNTLKYNTIFYNDKYEVYYNKSFTMGNCESYSTTLRPDISILDKGNNCYFHFDAKYKIQREDSNGESKRDNKNEDIHKMHAYLDAIYASKCSIALYPGDNFKFYIRREVPLEIKEPTEITELNGVGVIPLTPGTKNELFAKFMKSFF